MYTVLNNYVITTEGSMSASYYIYVSIYLYVLLSILFKAQAVMVLHSFLCFVALSNNCLFTIPLCGICSSIDLFKFVKQPTHRSSLLLFLSMGQVNVKFSSLSFFIMCPKDFSCLSCNCKQQLFVVPILLKVFSFLPSSLHGNPYHPPLQSHLGHYKSFLQED